MRDGRTRNFAIVTPDITTPNQRAGLQVLSAHGVTLKIVEAQEDSMLSFSQTVMLINKYGDKLQALWA